MLAFNSNLRVSVLYGYISQVIRSLCGLSRNHGRPCSSLYRPISPKLATLLLSERTPSHPSFLVTSLNVFWNSHIWSTHLSESSISPFYVAHSLSLGFVRGSKFSNHSNLITLLSYLKISQTPNRIKTNSFAWTQGPWETAFNPSFCPSITF